MKKSRDVSQALKRKGFVEEERDHKYYLFHHNGKKTAINTKISHGRADISRPLCSAMAKQIKLTGGQFEDFVDCSLTHAQYIELLLAGKFISDPRATDTETRLS